MLFSLVLGLNAAGAGFNSLAAEHGVLEVGEQADNARPHAVGALNGAAVNFTALGAHSWHKIGLN